MPWKPITEQLVVANLGGKVRQILVTAWNSDTGAIKVNWPLQIPPAAFGNRSTHVGKTKLEVALYEPLDPDAFLTATRGK